MSVGEAIRKPLSVRQVAVGLAVLAVAGLAVLGRRWAFPAASSSEAIDGCRDNLLTLHKALGEFAAANAGRPPQDFAQLLESGTFPSAAMACPGTGRKVSGDYFYRPAPRNAPAESLVACDLHAANHASAGRNVLTADGTVRFLGEEAFLRELAAPANRSFATALSEASGDWGPDGPPVP